jgi:hypothetical protein
MMFHLGFELPVPQSKLMNAESPDMTQEEIRIVKEQIRRNSLQVDQFVNRLMLLVLQERYPAQAVFIQKIRRRLEILMEENDTFRKVLWKHYQKQEMLKQTHRNIQ